MWKLTQKNTAVMWIICLCVPVILLERTADSVLCVYQSIWTGYRDCPSKSHIWTKYYKTGQQGNRTVYGKCHGWKKHCFKQCGESDAIVYLCGGLRSSNSHSFLL